jgi:predicted Rossmann fold nucleotide-binding protein DprA/Smf involved in DNA uptake
MSTNMAKRNSTPSRLVASVSSAALVIEVASRSSVLVTADDLR